MNALIQYRSLRQRLSWWLALQSFAGLGLVCLAVYLVTEFNFRDRQEDTLAQKENVIRHLLADGKEHGKSETSRTSSTISWWGTEICRLK